MTSVGSALAEARARPWLAGIDPRVKLSWLACLSVAAVTVDSTFALVALFVAGGAPLFGIRMRLAGWLALAGVLLVVVWSTVLTQALFYGAPDRTLLFWIVPASADGGFGGIGIWREGVGYGLLQSLRLTAMCQSGLAVCLSTSPSRLLEGMRRCGLPAPVAFVAATALRSLPEVVREFALVRQARRMRGAGRARRAAPVRAFVEIGWAIGSLEPVLARGLRRSAALATSVTLRGFDATARVRLSSRLTRSEAYCIGGMAGAAILLTLVKTLASIEWPKHEWAAPLHAVAAFARQWL